MAKKTKQATEPAQEIDNNEDLEIKKEGKGNYKNLIDQIEAEYQLAWWFMKPKLDEWGVRLKLYNNQKRKGEAVGDPLLFTIHQTVLASLYSD